MSIIIIICYFCLVAAYFDIFSAEWYAQREATSTHSANNIELLQLFPNLRKNWHALVQIRILFALSLVLELYLWSFLR